jgi:hypothetical protein
MRNKILCKSIVTIIILILSSISVVYYYKVESRSKKISILEKEISEFVSLVNKTTSGAKIDTMRIKENENKYKIIIKKHTHYYNITLKDTIIGDDFYGFYILVDKDFKLERIGFYKP